MNTLALLTTALFAITALAVLMVLATAVRRTVRATWEARRTARADGLRTTTTTTTTTTTESPRASIQ